MTEETGDKNERSIGDDKTGSLNSLRRKEYIETAKAFLRSAEKMQVIMEELQGSLQKIEEKVQEQMAFLANLKESHG
ncbi:uncharacterized protein N7469_002125 [Penicillium citrinum]|uniref:Uncharacterized protein n=1 Tax=Penicillium citrinum TaxID=5077 RepID=A0A9W9TV22_PENCI|nr:uncharacterized protein N7469_002125 [Penicillium citrinum]KAJ5240534.1 hypothetical protein N7469_002125 [Penicillium citrinum]